MNILVTGSRGYLASWLIDALLNNTYHSVVGLSRKPPQIADSNYTHIQADFSQRGWECRLANINVDCIVHLAQSLQYANFPNGTADMMAVNIESTGTLLKWASENGVKKFIFSSTGNVYQPHTGWMVETDLCVPTSFYGASKYCGELLCLQFSALMDVEIFRIFGLYGPGQKNMLIPKLIDSIKHGRPITLAGGKGLCLTPIYVDDAVDVLLKCLSMPTSVGTQIFNLSGDEVLSLDEISAEIASQLGMERNAVILEGAPIAMLGSNRKIKEAFATVKMSSFKTNLSRVLS